MYHAYVFDSAILLSVFLQYKELKHLWSSLYYGALDQKALLSDRDRHFKTITCPLLFSLERRNVPLLIQDVI